MKIVIYSNDKKILEYDYGFESKTIINFASSQVKEISFVHEIEEKNVLNDLIFQELYKKLKNLNQDSITDIYCYFSNEQYYHFHSKIKNFLYRSQGYVEVQNYKILENLSIRFQEENKINIVDNEPICDKKCPYLNTELKICTQYYNKKLLEKENNFLVCQECFLENDFNVRHSEKFEQYCKISSKYLEESL